MIALAGLLGCVPRVHIEWSTVPDLRNDDPINFFAVVDESQSPVVREALEGVFIAAGRLREGCDSGAEARIRLTATEVEERVDVAGEQAGVIRYELPPTAEQRLVETTFGAGPAGAQWRGRVHLSWVVEHCDGEVIEQVRGTVAAQRSEEAGDPDTARAELPEELLTDLVRSSGYALARRFVPTSGRVVRRWYQAGDRRLRLAAVAVRAGHWDAAATTWWAIVSDPASPSRVRARALHDLAVRHEARGEYARAWSTIRVAEETTASPAILRYRRALEQTSAETRSLRPYAPLDPEETASP